MKKQTIKEIFKDKEKRWQITVAISFLASVAFAIYNGFLGIFKHSIWNGSICVYYMLLLSIKALILINENKIKNKDEIDKKIKRKKTFYTSSILLFLINVALLAPITLMVLNKKSVELSMVAGIAIATYTTYKIIISIVNYTKNRKNENLAFRQIRTINLIDAILSILTLQNTLISINGANNNKNMFILTIISSLVGISIIITLSIVSLVRCIKENKQTNSLANPR